jgi:hypothetical protein
MQSERTVRVPFSTSRRLPWRLFRRGGNPPRVSRSGPVTRRSALSEQTAMERPMNNAAVSGRASARTWSNVVCVTERRLYGAAHKTTIPRFGRLVRSRGSAAPRLWRVGLNAALDPACLTRGTATSASHCVRAEAGVARGKAPVGVCGHPAITIQLGPLPFGQPRGVTRNLKAGKQQKSDATTYRKTQHEP